MGIRRIALIFAVVSAVYWSGISGLLAIVFSLAGKDVAPLWMVTLINFLSAAIYALAALFFCHWFARHISKRLRVSHPIELILPVENHSSAKLTVMLEPQTYTEEIEIGQAVELVMPSGLKDEALQFDYHDEQWLSVWLPADASIRIRKD